MSQTAKRHPCTKLTEDQVKGIVRCRQVGKTYRAIALRYHVSMTTVCQIMKGRVWKWVTGFKNIPPNPGAQGGENHPSAKLTAEDVLEIVRRRQGGEQVKSIAASYEVSTMAISDIVNGHSWRQLTGIEQKPNGSRRLSTGDILEIRTRHASGESQASLAREFHRSKTSIHFIITGKSYRDSQES